MTNREFHKLCNATPVGTPLSFFSGGSRVRGKFVGCSGDGIVIEANEQVFTWPRHLIDAEPADHPLPSSF